MYRRAMIQTFKEALQEDLRHSKVPAKVVAEELDMGYKMLMNVCNPEQPKFQIQARKLPRFVQVTGNRHAVEFLAQAIGCVLLDLPEIPASFERIEGLVADNVKEFGDVLTEIGRALADHRVTALEAKRLEREINEQIGKAMALLEAVKAAAGVGGEAV